MVINTKEDFTLNKDKQFREVMGWLDALTVACEQVVYETDASLIEPFELVNLVNVRLHMEDITSKNKESKSRSEPNLVLLPNKKNKKDDTH
jgi:hypothetical protein